MDMLTREQEYPKYGVQRERLYHLKPMHAYMCVHNETTSRQHLLSDARTNLTNYGIEMRILREEGPPSIYALHKAQRWWQLSVPRAVYC